MALELSLKIGADASEAKQALTDVESGIQRVEASAKKTQEPIGRMTQALGGQSEKVDAVVRSTSRLEQATLRMSDVDRRRLLELSGLAGGFDDLRDRTTKLESATLALNTSTLAHRQSLMLWGAAAAGAALVGAGLLKFFAEAVQAYDRQTGALNESRQAVGRFGSAWEDFLAGVGERIVPRGGTPGIIDLLTDSFRNLAPAMTEAIDVSFGLSQLKRNLAELDEGAGLLNILINGTGGPLNLPLTRQPGIFGRGGALAQPQMQWLGPTRPEDIRSGAVIGGPGRLTAGDILAIEWEIQQEITKRWQQLDEKAAREAEALTRFYATVSPGWSGVPGRLPGTAVVPEIPFDMRIAMGEFFPGIVGSQLGPSGWSGLPTLPGIQMPMPMMPNLPPFPFTNRFLGNLAPNLGGLLYGGNPLISGVGLAGNAAGSALVGGFSSSFASSFLGQALGGILPGLGGLVAPLLGKLFGPTEYEKRTRAEAAERQQIVSGVDMGQLQQMAAFTGRGDLLQQFMTVRGSAQPEYLKQLLGDLEDQTNRLTAAMQKYGISWEELGDKAQQSQIDQLAKELIQDFDVLVMAGADVNFVIEKMGDSVNEFLQAAIRTGSEVPAAMRFILQRMIDLGLLVDENGDAFMSLEETGVKFSKTMTQGFDAVVLAINRVARALGVDIPEAADKAADAMGKIPPPPEYDTGRPGRPDDGGEDDFPPTAASGGYLWNGKVYPYGGSFAGGGPVGDAFMIRAHSGEFVLNRAATQRIGVGALSALNRGQGTGTTTVILQLDGRRAAEVVVPHIPGVVKRYGLA
jgi:hypothetical protein